MPFKLLAKIYLNGLNPKLEFQVQSASNQILEAFNNMIILWSFNLCDFMIPKFTHIV